GPDGHHPHDLARPRRPAEGRLPALHRARCRRQPRRLARDRGLQARAAAEAHPGRAGRAADEPPSALTPRPERAGPRGRLGVRLLDVRSRRPILGVRPTGAKLQAPAAEHLPKIHQALAEHRTLRTRYYSASRDSEDTRAIAPHHLTLHNGGLYVVGHCHLRNAVRIFAVERMRTLELTRGRFEVPASFDAEN